MCVKDRPVRGELRQLGASAGNELDRVLAGKADQFNRNETAGCYGMIWNVDGSGVCANGVQGLHMSRRMHATYGVRVVVFTIIQYKH